MPWTRTGVHYSVWCPVGRRKRRWTRTRNAPGTVTVKDVSLWNKSGRERDYEEERDKKGEKEVNFLYSSVTVHITHRPHQCMSIWLGPFIHHTYIIPHRYHTDILITCQQNVSLLSIGFHKLSLEHSLICFNTIYCTVYAIPSPSTVQYVSNIVEDTLVVW